MPGCLYSCVAGTEEYDRGMILAASPDQGYLRHRPTRLFNINYKNTEILHVFDFRDFLDFLVENLVFGAWEGLKKVGGGVALRCDRVSCRGEPWGPDS